MCSNLSKLPVSLSATPQPRCSQLQASPARPPVSAHHPSYCHQPLEVFEALRARLRAPRESTRPSIDREAARARPAPRCGRTRVSTARARPPRVRAALPWPPGRLASPPRLRQRQQKSPRKPCQTALNRSMPTCKRTALPEPSAAGYLASELAQAPGPAAQPSTTAKSAIGRCSSRCPTGSCTSCSR